MATSHAIQPASWLVRPTLANAWSLSQLAGTLTELAAVGASATTTFAMRLVWEAQSQGEPACWVTGTQRCFYPPDAVANGVDLDALAVVRADGPHELGKAADMLVRSGAFGLLVLDLGKDHTLADRQLTRLLGLARAHGTAIVCLTHKADAQPSLGAAISLRAGVRRTLTQPGQFGCELYALKDKRRAPGWRHEVMCRAPAGLR